MTTSTSTSVPAPFADTGIVMRPAAFCWPARAIFSSDVGVRIGYYTQLANGQLRVDSVSAILPPHGDTLRAVKFSSLGPSFDLIPSNNPLPSPAFPAHTTTNYDRTIRPCYDIGEYMSAANISGDEGTVFAFGDNRNSWTSPAASPAAGTHSQPDVFAKIVHAQ